MVDHDTTIPPGRVGTITPQVRLKGMHGGRFSKSITVESDAANEPRLTLRMGGYIIPVIEVKPSYMRLVNGAPIAEGPAVTLKSRKQNLKIMDAVFKSRSGGPGGFRSMLPILPTVKMSRSEAPDSTGMYTYTLKMAVEAEITQDLSGSFTLTTNHPKKPEVVMNGRITQQK